MRRHEFYDAFAPYLRNLASGRHTTELQPDTHLWAAGYLDSISVLDVLSFLETLTGREVVLEGEFLPTFFTMESIFETYVLPATTSGAGDASSDPIRRD